MNNSTQPQSKSQHISLFARIQITRIRYRYMCIDYLQAGYNKPLKTELKY